MWDVWSSLRSGEDALLGRALPVTRLSPLRHSGPIALCWWFCGRVAGCSPARSRVDPHRREAVPVWDLWDSLPSPANVEEPPAHPHGREALPCRRICHPPGGSLQNPFRDGKTSPNAALFSFSVWKMQLALPPQESAAAAPSTEARRHHQHEDPVQDVDGGHAYWLDEGVLILEDKKKKMKFSRRQPWPRHYRALDLYNHPEV